MATNSRWLTGTPFPTAAPTVATAMNTSVLDAVANAFGVTRITPTVADIYLTLNYRAASSSNYDFILEPGATYSFMSDPHAMNALAASGADWQVGFEAFLMNFYLTYIAQQPTWVAAPTSSTGLITGMCSDGQSLYLTNLMVQGSGDLYVTLDGTAASAGNYHAVLTDTGHYRPQDAFVTKVAPGMVNVFATGGIDYKYGFWQYPNALANQLPALTGVPFGI